MNRYVTKSSGILKLMARTVLLLLIYGWSLDLFWGADRSDRVARPRQGRLDKVIRGPYLQSGTPNSMVIRWRTDRANTSIVRYGESLTNLNQKATGAGVTSEHVVLLTGLKTNTQYFYAVGTTNLVLAGSNANYFFYTAPVPGEPKPTRLWVLGDAGTRTTNQAKVRDAYYHFAGSGSHFGIRSWGLLSSGGCLD